MRKCKKLSLKRTVSACINSPKHTLPSNAVLLSEASAGVRYAQTPFLYPTQDNKSRDESLGPNQCAYQ